MVQLALGMAVFFQAVVQKRGTDLVQLDVWGKGSEGKRRCRLLDFFQRKKGGELSIFIPDRS